MSKKPLEMDLTLHFLCLYRLYIFIVGLCLYIHRSMFTKKRKNNITVFIYLLCVVLSDKDREETLHLESRVISVRVITFTDTR